MELREQLAVLTAMEKACSARIKEIRKELDGELLDAYIEDGVQKVALRVGGAKVGDYMVPLSKPTFKVIDERAFSGFALDYDLGRLVHKVEPHKGWEKRMTFRDGKVYLEDSGLEVPGVAYMPERPMTPRVTNCDPDMVLPLVNGLLGQGVAGLLEER